MIETIVLDLGGVLMNHDIPACVKRFKELMGENFSQLGLDNNGEPAPYVASILYDYEIGGASSDDFVNALLPLCKAGTTPRDILDAWNLMLTGIPAWRLERVLELRKRYPLFLLSNNNEEHWRFIMEGYFEKGKPLEAYFDDVFLSHLMHLGKPDLAIYEEADKAIAKKWETLPTAAPHPYNKATTVFVDDLEANRKAAEAYGWQTCASLEELAALIA